MRPYHLVPALPVLGALGAISSASPTAFPQETPEPEPLRAAIPFRADSPPIVKESQPTSGVQSPDEAMGLASRAPIGEVFYQPAEAVIPGHEDRVDPLAPQPHLLTQGPIERLHYAQRDQSTWIRGAKYKACVESTGFTYIPFLGSEASRNYPVTFRLATATLAGEPLELSPKATVRRTDDLFTLERGPVNVLYDMGLDSVEQLFTVDAAGATGDLVLTLDVTTDLNGAPRTAGLEFSGPEGSVLYGAAVVLDSAGRSADVRSELLGATLKLTIPASFLAIAEGQVTVDPIITTFAVDTRVGDQFQVDVSYDLSNDAFTYAYERPFSSTDYDVYQRTYSSGGVFLSGTFMEQTSEDWRQPSIANMNAENTHLIVAVRRLANNRGEIVGRTLNADTFARGPILLIGDATNWSNERPDVGGNATTAAGMPFLVTWERHFTATEFAPRMRIVNAFSSMGSINSFQPSGNVQYTDVVVSQSTGNPSTVNTWNIAYRGYDTMADTTVVRTIQVNAAGSPVNFARTLVDDVPVANLDVSDGLALDGLAPSYLVAYDDFSPTTRDVVVLLCRDTFLRRRVDLSLHEHAIASRNQDRPQLATTTEDFIVSYHETDGAQVNVYATCLDLTESNFLAISERRTLLGSAGSAHRGAPAMASRASGGHSTSRYTAVAWAQNSPGSSSYDIDSVVHFASNGDSPAWQYCESHPNSTGDRGFIRLAGTRSASSSKLAYCSSLPPNQFSLLLAGSQIGFTANPGGSAGNLCLDGNLGRYNNDVTQISPSGTAVININPVAIPGVMGAVTATAGQIYQWQLWHRDFLGGSGTTNYTNAVTILFN